MRLLWMLVLGCLLSNGIWGAHNERLRISRSYKEAEEAIESIFDNPEDLEKKLSTIPQITPQNFFLFLNIYACSKTRNYVSLLRICEEKIKATDSTIIGICSGSSNIETCLYYFEELFCIDYTHEFTPYALSYLRSRIEAMIAFLEKFTKSEEAEAIVTSYKECIKAYQEDPTTYKMRHRILHPDEETWTFASYPEWV